MDGVFAHDCVEKSKRTHAAGRTTAASVFSSFDL
jgi:hypothetical protein